MSQLRLASRLLLAALFLAAGTLHLANPQLFLPIMPPWIPWHLFCILASGVFELLGGLGLLIPRPGVQKLAGTGLLLLLLAVFPAKIYMAVEHIQVHGIPSQPWMAWARLPLQPLLMLWIWWAAGRPDAARRANLG
jgi:uncharacterized membrane protein